MTPGARIKAAIEVVAEVLSSHQPADKAVKAWGAAHRFAGSKDRAAIRALVFAAFRHKGRAREAFGRDDPRAAVLTGAVAELGETAESIGAFLSGGGYAADPLSAEEGVALGRVATIEDAGASPKWPDWIARKLGAAYGEAAGALMDSLDRGAPLDIRVNKDKTSRDEALAALRAIGFSAEPTPLSPYGIRIARDDQRLGANIRTLPIYRAGAIDIQDEGSQLVALMAGAAPGMQVVDLCAGGGGKTIALAAEMGRKGQVYACDTDRRRLRAGQERVARAGLHIVQPRALRPWTPAEGGDDPDLADLAGRADLVFLDVPCTGSGAWRRQADAKWQLSEAGFAAYLARQAAILDRGAGLVKPGGRLVYVTCSIFPEENERQAEAFLARAEGFRMLDAAALFLAATGSQPPEGARASLDDGGALRLSPLATGTDGFFFAAFERVP